MHMFCCIAFPVGYIYIHVCVYPERGQWEKVYGVEQKRKSERAAIAYTLWTCFIRFLNMGREHMVGVLEPC